MSKLRLQEQDASVWKLLGILKNISPPQKSEAEWMVVENNLFAELKARKVEVETGQGILSHLTDIFLRPAFRSPAFAGAVCLIALVTGLAVFKLYQLRKPEELPFARVVLMQGHVKIKLLSNFIKHGYAAQKRKLSQKHISRGGDSVKSSGMGWRSVAFPAKVQEGQSFRTSENSFLVVQLDPGTGVKLLENTIASIQQANSKDQALFLKEGALLAKVNKRENGQEFKVVTPNAICQVVGTQFRVEFDESSVSTNLTVIQGRVKLMSKDNFEIQKIVEAGQAARLEEGRIMPLLVLPEIDILLQQNAEFGLLLESKPDATGKYGWIHIDSDPMEAQVEINGKPAGTTPFVIEKALGDYVLTVRYPGFIAWTRSIKVSEGNIFRNFAMLEKIRSQKEAKTFSKRRKALSARRPMAQTVFKQQDVGATRKDIAVMPPEYQKALEKMQNSDYEGSLELLRKLNMQDDLDVEAKVKILEKTAMCYRGIGDFESVLKILFSIYQLTNSRVKRDNLLWEIANVKAVRLGNHKDSEMDLTNYIESFPDGLWIREAYIKLAEIQYLLKKPFSAAKTYKDFIGEFEDFSGIDKAIYNLAYILGHDLGNCSGAITWYKRLQKDFPKSSYLENSIFWEAECLIKIGRIGDAEKKYRRYLTLYPYGKWKEASQERLEELAAGDPWKN